MRATQTEHCWRTADNKLIPLSKVTHQHWSNIYWYHLIFQDIKGMPVRIMQGTVLNAKAQIDKNFGGKILEWKPIFDFEIVWLQRLGMLKSGTSITDKSGNKIGNILTGPITRVPGIA